MSYRFLPLCLRSPARIAARSALAALLATSLMTAVPAQFVTPASAATAWVVYTTTRTEADVRAMWRQLQPTYSGSPYSVTPRTTAPYEAGVTRSEFIQDGLQMVNFARYLAGLPYDVTTTSVRNTDAQHGAVLMAASAFSHTPPKPEDMSQAFYDRGYASTSKSNIGYGYRDAESFQLGCLHDSGVNNLERVGHRRWLLNPAMKETGIGWAEGVVDGQTRTYVTTYALDRSRTGTVDYGFIAWPSAGVFPAQMFDSATPWSVTINADRYDWTAGVGHTVTLRRISDGRTWTFNLSHKDKAGHYFNADFSNRGIANAFIFRPDPKTISYNPGDEFEVTLTGGIFLKGTKTPATITYWTQFVSMYDTDDPTPPGDYYEGVVLASERLADRTRFSTAVAIAKAAYPGWEGVKNVVIASGDDRAAADPLAASGLCWAYDAPMLLVSATRTPDEVKAAVKEIVAKNDKVTLRVVGGPLSVPDTCIAELVAAGGGSAKVTADRVLSTGGRYDLSRAIALRMRAVAAVDPAKTMPSTALFANGADPTKSFDALALSPIASAKGAPILLVTATSVPQATAATINDLKPSTKIVGGGPNTVSETVRTQLGATRWSGRTRYDTAIAIANGAVSKGWLVPSQAGLAAKLPDALTGGSFMGRKGGVLLLTDGAALTPVTKTWLTTYKSQVEAAYIFGGTASISDTVRIQVGQALQ